MNSPPVPPLPPQQPSDDLPDEYRLADAPDARRLSLPLPLRFAVFFCSACRLRLEAPEEQVGTMFTCPDCGRKNLVPPLPAPTPPPIDVMAGHDPNEMPLGEAPQRATPSIVPINLLPREAEELEAASPLAEPRARRTGPRVVLYRWPFVRGVLNFPGYMCQGPRLAILAIGLAIEGSLIRSGLDTLQRAETGAGFGGLIPWVSALGSTVMMLIWGLFYVAYASAYALQIVEQTAAGADRHIHSTSPTWLEWFLDGVVVGTAAFVSLIPGLVCRWLLHGLGLPAGWCIPLSMFAFFPLLLLSILEANSVTTLVSWPIWSSVWIARRAWGQFYLIAALLLMTLAGGAWLAFKLPDLWGMFVASLLIAAGMMIYCRLLGRITWFIPETRLSVDDDEDEDADDGDSDSDDHSLAV